MIDKSVIVTGASSGLGRHITRRLVNEGARVVAAARRTDRLEQLAAELADAPGQMVPVTADVTRIGDVEAMVAAAIAAFGELDALVNNAGMEIMGSIEELSEESLETMLQTNVVGPFLCTRAALPHLKQRGGSIVNLGSTVVPRAPRNRFGYVGTKGAVDAMSQALAGDLGVYRIRVNVVRPGAIPSELRGLTEEQETETLGNRILPLQALPDLGHGSDVASVVAFLVSDESAWMTGTLINVDGGHALGG